MTAPKSTTKAPPTTAVATRPPAVDAEEALAQLTAVANPRDREHIFLLTDALKQSRMVRGMASVVAATEWGQAMSPARQAAFAKYCLALGADPLRHVDLLGGNVFVNGDYFRDVISANPEFLRADDPRWIHADKRLQLCVACGKLFEADVENGHGVDQVAEENRRRLFEWIERARLRTTENVPDESPSACILVLYYGNGRGPFKGIGEVHPGKTDKGHDRDPIGLQSPRATAETRAWREAGEKAEATWFRTHASTLQRLEGKIKDAYVAEKEIDAKLEAAGPEPGNRPVIVDEGAPMPAIAPGPVADEQPPKTVKHAASGICAREDEHLATDCGYHRPKSAA